MVDPRIELGTTRLSAPFGRPALDYHLLFSFRIHRFSRVGVPVAQWFGRRSNPHLLGFNQALYRLSYQTALLIGNFRRAEAKLDSIDVIFHQRKKPAVCDAGFETNSFIWPSVYKRNGSATSKLPCSATRCPHFLLAIELDRKHIIELKFLENCDLKMTCSRFNNCLSR